VPNARVTREARQAKAAEMRRQVARKEAQRKTLIASSAVLAVIIVIVAVFVVVQHANRTSAIANGATPANLSSDNSVTVGKSDAKVTMVAYEDFQCPYCEQFETSMSDQLAKWEADGTLKVEYKMIAFLDASSSTDYSTRALNAAAAVNNYDPSAFAAFHKLLYANQPKEGSAGLTDATLVKYAMQATNNQFKTQITTAVKNQTYKGWTQKVTDNMSKNGVNGTPTLIVNGTTLKGFDTTTVTNAIEAAAK
jgi:protein-disulfide isomerase